MTISVTDLEKTLSRIRVFDDELSSLLEERQRMISLLQLTPSANDNFDVINSLEKTQRVLQYFEEDFTSAVNAGVVSADNYGRLWTQFESTVAAFKRQTDQLADDPYLDASEYHFIPKAAPGQGDSETTTTSALKSTTKSAGNNEINHKLIKSGSKLVRFKDNPVELEPEEDPNRSQLFGSGNNSYTPYRDDDTDAASTILAASSFDIQSNQQIFAQHQQQLLDQDDQLDFLHGSVRRQHQMGIGIRDEIDDHLILLNDLELGIDSAGSRLLRAQGRLKTFRTMARENGSLVTIIILTIILITLLVVLN